MNGQKSKKKIVKKKVVKTRRSNVKYPALDPKYNLKTRQELIEVDYIDQLNDKEKEWLNSFNEEYVNANFNHKGKKLHKKAKQKKSCYSMNNARNRDILSREKASGAINYIEDMKENQSLYSINEDLVDETHEVFDDLDETSANGNNGSDNTN